MKKLILTVVLVLTVLSVTLLAAESPKLFSQDTLSLYNGRDGNPGYVAYRGRVYDVSETWPTGSHSGFLAGTDITEPMKDSAHGAVVLDKLPIVGYFAANYWTIDELAYFDGREGRPAYVAVYGVVYDVSETWPTGSHRGFSAGTEITDPIQGAPHEMLVLDKLPVVGAVVSHKLTLEELRVYDGRDGRRGFVAVNGVVYDVSKTWPTGSHRGFSAGTDIAEAIKGSVHEMDVLGKLPIVGYIPDMDSDSSAM